MGWFSDAYGWVGGQISKFVNDYSWLEFSKVAGAILIVLAVIGLVSFWWWLLHKAMNHGGDH